MSCPTGYKEEYNPLTRTISCVPDATNIEDTNTGVTYQKILEARASAAQSQMETAKVIYENVKQNTVQNLQYVAHNPKIPQFILLGTAMILIVFAIVSIKG